MKILHVEDNAQDAELIERLVSSEWPDCTIDLLNSRQELLDRIASRKYDIVLSDFSMGSFTGMDALSIVKERSPDTPFIFVSGTIGEDRAIEAVRSGAHDYVIKDRMKRLITAIHRAIEDGADRRRKAETDERIRQQAEFLNKARDAIVVTNLDGAIAFWNQGAERISGWKAKEVLGKQLEEIFGVGFGPELEKPRMGLETEDEWRKELRLVNRAGKELIVELSATLIRDDSGNPKARLSIATDITEQKALEEKFLRVQRLESIGMLASGIAHDLNNVLAPIFLVAPMLRDQITNPLHLQMINTLEKSAERGAALVRQILSFAQGANGANQLVQIKHLMRDTASVINETFPKNIQLSESIPDNLWPILANPTQVHQVVLNLCVNARDAMPQGGKLRLRAENCTLDAEAARAIEGASPGQWVVVHVEDSGTGIPDETLARIWEPFFTTKEVGKGTGLGLSTVRGIVESHRGFIQLTTANGKGTTFRVYFPAEGIHGLESKSDSGHPFNMRGNGELILVVDDEVQLRDVTAATLVHYGYKVMTAADGAEALAVFATHSADISLVITDLNMPNLDGAALANVIQRLNPKMKILAITGMADGDADSLMDRVSVPILPKPFTATALLNMTSSLLGADKASSG